jgi:hypothetical protein
MKVGRLYNTGNKKMKKLLFASAVAISASVGFAHANTVTGSIWEGDATGASNATVANVPVTTPDVTFTTTAPLQFQAGQNGVLYTIGGFLQSTPGGSTYITGSSHSGDALTNVLFNFTGNVSVTNGQTFTVGHDDGLTLVINGVTVVNQPTPTAFANTSYTWTGLTGTYPFQLVYGECCTAPAVLNVQLPLVSSVPLPAALPLFATGLGCLGFLGLRRKRKAEQAGLALAI